MHPSAAATTTRLMVMDITNRKDAPWQKFHLVIHKTTPPAPSSSTFHDKSQ
jgi:hypothetical protein